MHQRKKILFGLITLWEQNLGCLMTYELGLVNYFRREVRIGPFLVFVWHRSVKV